MYSSPNGLNNNILKSSVFLSGFLADQRDQFRRQVKQVKMSELVSSTVLDRR